MSSKEFQNHVLPLKNKLFAYAFSLLSIREEAKDVVQDVMVKVWEEQKELNEYRSLEAWCVTLTRNRALDRMKRKDWRQEDVEEGFGLQVEQANPEQQLEQKDMLQNVKSLIAKLPIRQREIILLRDFQEHTYDEIAEILGIDMNQVKVYLHRARKFIKEEMKKRQYYGIGS